jgi:hypothetical protein
MTRAGRACCGCVSGGGHHAGHEARADEQAYDAQARRRLRELSERLVRA